MNISRVRVLITAMLIAIVTLTIQWRARGQSATTSNAQTVSQTGLLPVYGVDFAFDPSWVDASQFPSQSAAYPNAGTSQMFQQVWDGLKASGFNVLRFPIDVRDAPASVNRFANLCLWAQKNNVKVVPILTGAERSQPVGPDFSANVAAFIKAVTAALAGGQGGNLKAYSQIMAYQLEDEMNHAGRHAAMSPEAAQLRLIQAAGVVHQTEQQALKDSGLNQTPVMVNASFDYELIKLREIAGAPLSDEAYAKSYSGLKQFLSELANSSDIDLIGVDWFAGSISAGGVDKFSTLLRSLTTDFPGKQIVFTTGSSSAFNSADDQKKFYALTFANLADFHVSEGVDAPFVGIFYYEALSGQSKAGPAPAAVGDMTKWDWGTRADELARMWSGGASSDVMSWWLKQVESNMGLMVQASNAAGTSLAAQPALAGLTQIATGVSQANAVTANESPAAATDTGTANTNGASPSTSTSGSNSGFRQALKQKAQEGLLSVLDRVFQDLGNLVGPNGGGNGSNGGSVSGGDSTGNQPGLTTTASLALAKQDVAFNPVGPRAAEQVTVTMKVLNQSANADAANLVVALVDDASNVLSQVTNAAVARNSSQTFALQWTPTEAKTYSVSALIADANLNVLASAALDPVTVAAASNSSGASSSGNAPGLFGRGAPGRVVLPLGLPRVTNLTWESPGRSLFAGEPSSVAVSLTNPYTRPLTNLKATILIDGRESQSRTVATLLPGQSRSLLFPNTTIPQAGRHEVKVVLETREAKSNKGLATTQVNVLSGQTNAASADTTRPLPQRSVLPGRINVGGVAVRLNQPARTPVNPNSPNDKSNGQEVFKIRPITNTSVTSQPRDRQIKSGTTTSATNSSGGNVVVRNGPLLKPDLGISANDITYRPEAPKVGGPLALSAAIRNIGKADARHVHITCVLFADGRAVAAQDFLADVSVNGLYVVRWNVTTPASRRLRFEVSAILDADNNAGNNRASVEINVTSAGAPSLPPRTAPRRKGA